MLLSAVSVLVVAQSSSEIAEGLMDNSVYWYHVFSSITAIVCISIFFPSFYIHVLIP